MSRPTQSSNRKPLPRADTSAEGVTALAQRVLSVMSKRRTGPSSLSEAYLARLREVVGGPDRAARAMLVDDMAAAGIGRDEICDHYIPEVARRFGDDWCEDRMSFADVSIRSARLQSMLRDIALDDADAPLDGADTLAVMVIAFETHTLGATVITAKLRRLGASVRLMLGHTQDELEDVARTGDYDGILMSVAESDDLTMVNRAIAGLRAAHGDRIPIILGGGILETGPNIARVLTGADRVTNDLDAALILCASRRGARHTL